MVPDTDFHVRWLDIESPINANAFENNSFDLADNGGKANHAIDGGFAIASGWEGDSPDFNNRTGNNPYPYGDQVVMDIIQDKFALNGGTGIQDDWFESLDINLFFTPRKPNGDLPDIALLRPKAGTPIANMGYTYNKGVGEFADFWQYAGAVPLKNPDSFPESYK